MNSGTYATNQWYGHQFDGGRIRVNFHEPVNKSANECQSGEALNEMTCEHGHREFSIVWIRLTPPPMNGLRELPLWLVDDFKKRYPVLKFSFYGCSKEQSSA